MNVGVLGAGQLGRMLALAGQPLGARFRFFDPNPESPVHDVGDLTAADYGDSAALEHFVAVGRKSDAKARAPCRSWFKRPCGA